MFTAGFLNPSTCDSCPRWKQCERISLGFWTPAARLLIANSQSSRSRRGRSDCGGARARVDDSTADGDAGEGAGLRKVRGGAGAGRPRDVGDRAPAENTEPERLHIAAQPEVLHGAPGQTRAGDARRKRADTYELRDAEGRNPDIDARIGTDAAMKLI